MFTATITFRYDEETVKKTRSGAGEFLTIDDAIDWAVDYGHDIAYELVSLVNIDHFIVRVLDGDKIVATRTEQVVL